MDFRAEYEKWCTDPYFDEATKAELKALNGNDKEIEDRFYRTLEFGTAGLRGVIGAGTNRMNIYTVRQATQGLANYILSQGEEAVKRGVAIAHDSRNMHDEFTDATALCLAANGIKTYVFPQLAPVPELSYAVRTLGTIAGVVITASHNPREYNGYKVYWEDGAQVTPPHDTNIMAEVAKVTSFDQVKTMDREDAIKAGLYNVISDEVEEGYFGELKKLSIHPEIIKDMAKDIKIVYTPLHGTGLRPVQRVLKDMGFENVYIEPQQAVPDGNFPTCPFPNPEIKEALAKGLELCKTVKPDLLLATDPDCDRVGIAVPDPEGNYVLFSGNEVGAMLLKYICQERTALGTMPKNPVAVKTIVTTDICKKIAAEYNVELREVLTGFKFIGEQIGFLEKEGQDDRYIFGFEESYGYLTGSYVRDKDAVVGSMLMCEMAAFYRTKGISLLQAREDMYKKYGNYLHSQKSFQCEGASGMERMKEIMKDLRANPPKAIGGLKVVDIADYLASEETNLETGAKTVLTLPKSDVIAFKLEQGASVIIRPSGTEPKIKAYYTTIGDTRADAEAQEEKLIEDFKGILGF